MDGNATNQVHGDAGSVVQVRDIHGDLHLHQAQPSIHLAVPHQLPADVRQFSGRDGELDRLDALLAGDSIGSSPGTAVVICAIAGAAGVGKTALAVHWAHRVRDRFPDGQLYIDLLGYSPDSPVSPGQALESFLHVLGVSGDAIPPRTGDQAALYRSLLHGRRVLVLLDNADSPEQVRPLLPGSNSCFVLVTSRSGLPGLVSRDGAVRLTLDLLSADDSVGLLRDLVGAARVDAEPDAAQTLIDQCGRLPLALRMAAERAAAEPHLLLSELVAELADERSRLDLLASDDVRDTSTAIRAVFSWSYRGLPLANARMFRLLGLHPGPDFSVPVAAALGDVELSQAKRLVQGLASAHLVQPSGPGRYRFHDVLRLYAAELAEQEDPPEFRLEAARRMLRWYLYSANTADRLLLPLYRYFPLDLAEPPPAPVPFSSRDQALAWCEDEAPNLAAAVRYAAHLGEHSLAMRFPRALWSYYDLRKPWTDWITTYEIGLASAHLSNDESMRAWIMSSLGVAHYELERFDKAAAYLTEAMSIRRAIGDLGAVAGGLTMLGATYRRQGRLDAALECFREALTLRLDFNDRRGEAVTLSRLGATYRDLGRFDESLEHLSKSLSIRREIGDLHGEGFALHSLGATYEQLDQLEEAMNCYRQSLAVRRDIGDKRGEAEILDCMGKILRRGDQLTQAREVWSEALAIFSDLGAPQTADVAGRLRAINGRD